MHGDTHESEAFRLWLRRHGCGTVTVGHYLGQIRRLHRQQADANPADMAAWLAGLGAHPAMQRLAYQALGHWSRFRFGLDLPVTCRPARRPVPHPGRALPETVIRNLLQMVADPVCRLGLACCYGCGLRLGEVVRLHCEDLDLPRGAVFIRIQKWGGSRWSILPTSLRPLLADQIAGRIAGPLLCHRAGRVVNADSLALSLRQARRHLGLADDITTHCLRHSFATHLLHAGVDVEQVRRLLGHRSLATTALYLNPTQPRVPAATVDLLRGML